ncbi:DICT sensory domain-containing protein [Roseiflexus castenholzii]|uniref:Putative sensor protein n=1 Tax=Roseiflexus castenholzii (strain DSM 13941 / HLO8) TaxID=383372 RepID=A7NGH5_ROSCS|nr:DICT sensory domain-containing protein [Roseiflexus castenholzii]ABU56562.1 putative sensor protein [Roseiflexus castenholzii DSM 13941]
MRSTHALSLDPSYIDTLSAFSFAAFFQDQKKTLHSRSMMLALSYLIEDYAAAAPETCLIATFQRFSHYRRQAHRYHRFAPQLSQAFVLGFPDEPPPDVPGVTTIALAAEWPLVHEWTVIAWGPTIAAALVAYDEDRCAPYRASRRFQAVWIVSFAQIEPMMTAFYHALGQSAPVVTRDALATQRTTVVMQKELTARLRAIRH